MFCFDTTMSPSGLRQSAQFLWVVWFIFKFLVSKLFGCFLFCFLSLGDCFVVVGLFLGVSIQTKLCAFTLLELNHFRILIFRCYPSFQIISWNLVLHSRTCSHQLRLLDKLNYGSCQSRGWITNYGAHSWKPKRSQKPKYNRLFVKQLFIELNLTRYTNHLSSLQFSTLNCRCVK